MEQRNLLIAIVLSVGILIAFQFAFERMRPPQPSPPSGRDHSDSAGDDGSGIPIAGSLSHAFGQRSDRGRSGDCTGACRRES